jgi:hypothetical protein
MRYIPRRRTIPLLVLLAQNLLNEAQLEKEAAKQWFVRAYYIF